MVDYDARARVMALVAIAVIVVAGLACVVTIVRHVGRWEDDH